MSSQEDFSQVIEIASALVRKAAHPRRGTLQLSPEMAALFTAPTPIRGEEPPCATAEMPAEPEPVAQDVAPPFVPDAGLSRDAISAIPSLDELADAIKACRKCQLCTTRTQTVFCDGNPNADLVFVGEAPGADEDRQGVPFVGKAGLLLTDIIVKGMKMRREDVYICNVLKCRPPNNRDPLPSEKEQCEPYLIRQLELVKPKVICALGRHAANTLLRKEETTGRLRGKWHFYHGIPLRVTYHPAYLLRTPADKKLAWDDIQHVMRALSGEEDPFASASPGDGAPLFSE